MANGNDWDVSPQSNSSDSSGDDPYQAPEADDIGAPSGTSGGDPMSPTEGWGGGPFDFNELLDNTKLLFDRIKGPVLYAVLGIVVANLLLTWLQSGLQIMGSLAGIGTLMTIATLPMTLVIIPVSIALGSLQVALLGPIRDRVLGGRSFQGAWDVIRAATDRWLQVFLGILVFALGTVLTLACCVFPGFIFIFLASMSLYLLATRDFSIQKAFTRSYILSKKYWTTILVYFGIVIGASVVGGCLIGGGGAVIGMTMMDDPQLANNVASFVFAPVNSLIGILSFLFMASTFMTIDAHETGQSFRR